jgi:hypothetical protein
MGLTMPEVMAQLGINQDEKLIETDAVSKQNGSIVKDGKPQIEQ